MERGEIESGVHLKGQSRWRKRKKKKKKKKKKTRIKAMSSSGSWLDHGQDLMEELKKLKGQKKEEDENTCGNDVVDTVLPLKKQNVI